MTGNYWEIGPQQAVWPRIVVVSWVVGIGAVVPPRQVR